MNLLLSIDVFVRCFARDDFFKRIMITDAYHHKTIFRYWFLNTSEFYFYLALRLLCTVFHLRHLDRCSFFFLCSRVASSQVFLLFAFTFSFSFAFTTTCICESVSLPSKPANQFTAVEVRWHTNEHRQNEVERERERKNGK